MSDIEIRPLAARDSFEELTALLHRAYAPLAAAGLNFGAATQTPQHTARRAAEGQCFVAIHQSQPVGMLTVAGPFGESTPPGEEGDRWYREPNTAHLHQFGVDPAWQRQGVGRRLVAAGEEWARQMGYRLIVMDTAGEAAHLRAMFRRLGYADLGTIQWAGRSYRSVVMRKALDDSPLRIQFATLARYNLWATTRLMAHVDALSETDYRAHAGLFFGSIHGTLNHLLVGEHLLWFRRFAYGESPAVELDAEVEPDRARLRQRLLAGAVAWLPQLDEWTSERLAGTLSYRRISGEAVTLPFAPTLLHVFNHGTHHRGQISAALTSLGQACPELDLVLMLQAESRSPT
jgi:uncharacterized damage-inducible protein DinB/ribosomal protein S18 acetylase RimI-like enzyme